MKNISSDSFIRRLSLRRDVILSNLLDIGLIHLLKTSIIDLIIDFVLLCYLLTEKSSITLVLLHSCKIALLQNKARVLLET